MASPFWDNSVDADGDVLAPGAAAPGLAENGLYSSNPWDLVKLQGIRLPGICDLQIREFERRLQSQKKSGTDGATPTFRGLNPAKIDITIRVWTAGQYALMQRILPVIFPLPGADPSKLNVMDVSHPNAQALQIRSLVIRGVSGFMPGQQRGEKTIRLTCEQYVAHKNKGATKTPTAPVATTASFQPTPGKNAPPPPSSTDGGPVPNFQPAGGGA